MQYGNSDTCVNFVKEYFCLNRTMQYGNFIAKPKPKKIRGCLNRTMQYGNDLYKLNFFNSMMQFKSYYVVWKLFERKQFLAGCRLNRTMQYGNKNVANGLPPINIRLNRTMQYGNAAANNEEASDRVV